MTHEYEAHAKATMKAVHKRKTKEYVEDAKRGHSGAKKVLAMADKPHKAKKAYKLSIKRNIKASKAEREKAHKHMHEHMR